MSNDLAFTDALAEQAIICSSTSYIYPLGGYKVGREMFPLRATSSA